MPFKYNPPTRTTCAICDQLFENDKLQPIIDSHNGKASSANQYPFHNWYNFVLGYSPEFPEYMLAREEITPDDLIFDPFMGSGTTLITCKMANIPSVGVDANDYMVDTARVKLNWDTDVEVLKIYRDNVLEKIEQAFRNYRWSNRANELQQMPLLGYQPDITRDPIEIVETRRPEMLLQKYISDKPLARAYLIDDVVNSELGADPLKAYFDLALTSIIVPISNVRYGPGFGVIKPKDDVDVLALFSQKINRMIKDLEAVSPAQKHTPSHVQLGDSRYLQGVLPPNSVSLMVTSPPYPGDHEYTKHTRLELIFRGYATNQDEFKVIKKRMLTASTTNIYKEDNDRDPVKDLPSIQAITKLIQQRLEHDGATSGFEKLYTRLVWEYFGGMYKALQSCYGVLKPGGKIALLVSDSHAFKMVHIQTAAILQEIGEMLGYVEPETLLWQLKVSTSHKYYLRENILILTKPSR